MFVGTPLLVPLAALFVCFYQPGTPHQHFDFERKAFVVIFVTVLSALLDYWYAPGTHDPVGFSWMLLLWSYGLFVLCYGLVVAKLLRDFSFKQAGLNCRTLLAIVEILVLLATPILYQQYLHRPESSS
jgi:hypothetical protein